MADPRVTVFIPTRNRSSLLRSAIESVLTQTYADFRLEISDNASTDDTGEVIAALADSRIDYVRQPENLGILGNHNQFLTRVRTELALILPDDDLLYPELLEHAVRALDATPRAGVVHSSFDVIGGDGEVIQADANWTYGLDDTATVESPERFIAESMRWSCRVCASTALLRTKAIPEGGMRESDLPAVDFGMWLRIAAAGWEFAFQPETRGAYRIHDSSHSAAFGEPQGPGYAQDVQTPARLRAIKHRFLDEVGDRLDDPRRLRRLANRAQRHELAVIVRSQTLPERRPGPTLRALWRAGRIDPSLALHGDAWRLGLASVLGPRVVDRLRGRSIDPA